MANRPQSWQLPYLTGRCFDFALALAEIVEGRDFEFISIGGSAYPEHVGIRVGAVYADVRGILTEDEFLAMGATTHDPEELDSIGREVIELHCGLAGMRPPYKGNADIRSAREAVSRAFPDGFPEICLPAIPARKP